MKKNGAKTKLILGNLAVLLFLLLLLEVSVRIFFSFNAPFDLRSVQNVEYDPSGYTRYWLRSDQVVFETNEGKIDSQKVKFRINDWGYRGYDFDQIREDTGYIVIAILGGSHIFDLNCFDYQGCPGFPMLLEEKFRTKGYKVRVINAGTPGANSCDFPAKILFDLSKLDPDFVIINSIWNDSKWISRYDSTYRIVITPPRAQQPNPLIEPVSLLDKVLGWSVVYRKVRDYYWKVKLKKFLREGIVEGIIANKSDDLSDFTLGLQQYRKNIIASIELSRLIGAQPILAIEERLVSDKNSDEEKRKIGYHMVNVKNHDELVSIFRSCDTILMELAHEYDVPLVNVNAFMEGDVEYFSDHVHTTPKGSKFMAEMYFNELLKMKIVDP